MKNKKKNQKKKNMLLIYGLIGSIILLGGGYAIFSQVINVVGTATADADFDIVWQNPAVTADSNAIANGGTLAPAAVPTLTNGNHTLNIATTLEGPGNYVEYTVTIRNTGNLPAKITDITTTNPVDPEIVITYTPNFAVDQTLAAGATTDVVIRVEWVSSSMNQSPISVTFGVEVEYTQNT